MRECASHPIVQANYTMDEIKSVWRGITSFLEESLSAGKAVNIQNLGLFTFRLEKIDTGNKGLKVIRTPQFVVSERFTRSNNIRSSKTPSVSQGVPTIQLNASSIAMKCGLSRDVVAQAQKDIIVALGDNIRSGKSVSLDFGIGRLQGRAGNVSFQFGNQITNKVQLFEDRTKPPTTRVGTSSSTMRRPQTASSTASFQPKRPGSAAGSVVSSARSSRPGSARSMQGDDIFTVDGQIAKPSGRPPVAVPEIRAAAEAPRGFSDFSQGEDSCRHGSQARSINSRGSELCRICASRDVQVERKVKAKQDEAEHDRRLTLQAEKEMKQAELEEHRKTLAAKQSRLEMDTYNLSQIKDQTRVGSRPMTMVSCSDLVVDNRRVPPTRTLEPHEYRDILQEQIELRKQTQTEMRQREADLEKAAAERIERDLKKELAQEAAAREEGKRKQFAVLTAQINARNAEYDDDTVEVNTFARPEPTDHEKRMHARQIQNEILMQTAEKREMQRQRKLREMEQEMREIEQMQQQLDIEADEEEEKFRQRQMHNRSTWNAQLAEKERIARSQAIPDASATSLLLNAAREYHGSSCDRCTQPLPEGVAVKAPPKSKNKRRSRLL